MLNLPFLFGKNNFLGIDFGTSSIKIVELTYKDENTHLINYGWVNMPTRTKTNELEAKTREKDDAQIVSSLKKLLDKMDIQSNSANISIGSYRGLTALIKVNKVDDDDVAEIIKAEAGKHIPVSLDEVYLSWDIVSKNIPKKSFLISGDRERDELEGKKESAEVLLVAAPKEDVRRFEGIVSEVDLKVDSLELDIFSSVRSLLGNDLGVFLIVDVGARVTNLVLVEKGIVRVNRNINIGGDEITKNISSGLNVSWERAESFKKKNDYLSNEGKQMVSPVLEVIAKEANRIISAYFAEGQKNKIDSVILVGGGAGINKIDALFAEILGTRVSIGDPWQKITIENEKIKNNSKMISRSLAVATGLALKGVDNYKRKE
ncbi:MAG: type IV pilus assembly protein PilM [Candidatus Moranbacteria bacterium]|jgi:type IV pilus assembly protein PilM|nr:type IV pilus assembly protein PilM [Candidatus Moranbacteria bacterium]MDD5652371.1 type IV pilus assembly protein PilM [Candidatus Moranbacteria bacterium]MDX9855394.1 type IV pilus assembly protein PilM [Candidatus Moranbacteria bacterium]